MVIYHASEVIERSIYKPQLIFWETTKACPLACVHCRAEAMLDPLPDELTHDESMKLIESLTQFGKPYPILILTGGDVMLRTDLEDILKKTASLGIRTALSPAVSDRLTPKTAQLAKKYGVHSISLSLDWSSPERQDEFRGKYETFARTLDSIQIFSSFGLPVQINTTVYKDNIRDLPKMLSLVSMFGIKVWELFFLIRIGRGETLNDLTPYELEGVNLWISAIRKDKITVRTVESPIIRRVEIQRSKGQFDESNEVYRDLIAETEPEFIEHSREGVHEFSGRRMRTVFVGHNGNVLINGFIERPLGNTRKSSLKDICSDNPVLERLDKPSTFDGKCSWCEYNTVCGGSRARSFSSTGNLFESDPACDYVPVQIL